MTVEIHGLCDPQFEKLKETFLQNFKDGLEVGASYAATVNGKTSFNKKWLSNTIHYGKL